MVGAMCSMLPYGTGIFVVMHLYVFLSIPFLFIFFNLVLVNRRNGPRYQRVLALCAFFNRGDTEGTSSSKMLCSMFVYVLFLCKFVSGLILWFMDNLCF